MTDQDRDFYDKQIRTLESCLETWKKLYRKAANERDALALMLAELEPKQ